MKSKDEFPSILQKISEKLGLVLGNPKQAIICWRKIKGVKIAFIGIYQNNKIQKVIPQIFETPKKISLKKIKKVRIKLKRITDKLYKKLNNYE